MKPVSTFVVSPTMPQSLEPLKELAYNYWWCWNAEAAELFRRVDPRLWTEVHHNPVALLSSLSHDVLEQLTRRSEFMGQLREVHAAFRTYMDDRRRHTIAESRPASYIAYFCAEFGIHESFSSYSGGLGVLAGDHLKSASDLGLPLIAVGLLYQEGYFRQYLTQNGWQNEQYQEVDFHTLPLTQVTHTNGEPIIIDVELPTGTCFARLWKLDVGRIPLYLLDTNIKQNHDPVHRNITDRLYGGDQTDRIRQEIVLGIGGMKALKALGIEPAAIHVNEGHATYCMLERARQYMERLSMTFDEAFRLSALSTVFTTHTPVPAGNEVFRHDLLKPFFSSYAQQLGLTWEDFIKLGAKVDPQTEEGFSMTVLGLRGSSFRNGVSLLHGEVARTMWHDVWSSFGLDEVPISGLTNGVHTLTWVSPEMADLYDRYLGSAWRSAPHLESSWSQVDMIPSMELWRVHQRRRERLVIGAREHVLNKHSASLTAEQASHIHECLDPDVLTIGFARRFATYKRADLLFRDMDRLQRIVDNEQRPVQIILAGKSHPMDGLGKELIQSVHQKIKEFNLDHRIVFLEDYDMDTARMMVRGCDVWLNTPRRPYEASGTSGMKAAVNGVVNCSILDGWWAEAYDGENGFAIGRGEVFDAEEQDAADAETLYDMIEHAIVPRYYDVGVGRIPERWIGMMKHSIQTLAWRFSALRMVEDYAQHAYGPAIDRYRSTIVDDGRAARDASTFFAKVEDRWSEISIDSVNIDGTDGAHVGKTITVRALIRLGSFGNDEVTVQAVHGRVDSKGEITPPTTVTLDHVETREGVSLYEGRYTCEQSGVQGCTVRVIPYHPTLAQPQDALRVTYANGIS
jgi:glycogen phosphorylase